MTLQEAASELAAAASQAEADANFSKLYAIVGSMFDSSVSLPEQLSTIEHLPTEQRWRCVMHAAVCSAGRRSLLLLRQNTCGCSHS